MIPFQEEWDSDTCVKSISDENFNLFSQCVGLLPKTNTGDCLENNTEEANYKAPESIDSEKAKEPLNPMASNPKIQIEKTTKPFKTENDTDSTNSKAAESTVSDKAMKVANSKKTPDPLVHTEKTTKPAKPENATSVVQTEMPKPSYGWKDNKELQKLTGREIFVKKLLFKQFC